MPRDGQIIRPTGRISSIADINEANANRVPIDHGYHGDEPKRTWDEDGDFRPRPSEDPVASIVASSSGLTVNVSGTDSFDPEGKGLKFAWDFGDGSAIITTPTASRTYATAGVKTITLIVEDVSGLQDAADVSVTLVAPEVPPAG